MGGYLRNYKIDENGRMYEEEIEIKPTDFINEITKRGNKTKKLIGLDIYDNYDNCHVEIIRDLEAMYIYNPKSKKAIIYQMNLTGDYLIGKGDKFEELLNDYKNGHKTGSL